MILQRSLLFAGALAIACGALATETSPFAEPASSVLVAQSGAAAGNPAGQIVMSTSDLRASRDDGSQRSLARRSVIYEGDTLITGEAGITQVRMVDGALLSLRKNTQFKIEEFRYGDLDDKDERGFFSLLRGGFRTITGAIGSVVKQAYRVSTPVATIGIRGTHFGLRLCTDGDCASEGVDEDGLYGGVVDGSISSRNGAGASLFDNDEYFYVADARSRADALLAPPGVVFGSDLPPPSSPDRVAGLNSLSPEHDEIQEGQQQAAADALDSNLYEGEFEFEDGTGNTVLLPPAFGDNIVLNNARVADDSVAVTSFLLGQGATIFGNAFGAESVGVTDLPTESFVVVDTQDGSVPALQNVDVPNCSPCIAFAVPGETTLVAGSTGSNAALGVSWGRWQGDWIGSDQNAQGASVSSGQLHVMLSDSLIPEANLPATGAFTYNSTGGTAPTNHAGVAGVLNSASVDVNFGAMQITDYQLSASFGGDTVNAGIVGNASISDAANGGILLLGNCVAGCNASNVAGRASAQFVGGVSQGRPDGLISSYAVGGLDGDDNSFGFNGTFVAEPD